MATRQALSFPDVVNLICEQCDQSALAALARARRDFTEVVLNVLWRSIADLGPLIRCMPEDLWEEEAIDFERPRLMFRRPVLPTDWNRFKVHAARVRKLGFSDPLTARYDLGLNVYGALACASVGRLPLLPRLTHIRWLTTADDEFPYINLFLSPFITHLEFDIVVSNSDWSSDYHTSIGLRLSLLPSLVSACPNMAHLSLAGHGMSEETEEPTPWQEIKGALSAMEQWAALHHLEMEGIPDASILCVAKLPALRTLVIDDPDESVESLAPYAKGFPVLERLIVRSSTIEFCIMLLKSMSRTPLRSLRLESLHDTQTDQWPKLFHAIHQGITHNSLRNVHISCDYHYGIQPDEENLSITLEELSPLLAFTRLSEVSVEPFGQFKLDNKDLQTMASTWPRLQTLELVSLKPSEHWPQITIEGLSVVRFCPLLENLTIAFDASEAPDLTGKPCCSTRNERIRTLNVLYSPISNPAKVAAFLSDIFPNLHSIDLFSDRTGDMWDEFDELRHKWKEAESLVALFSSVRMQEKLRYTSTVVA